MRKFTTLNLASDDIKRFWKLVDIKEPNDCWNWKASLRSKEGEGSFCLNYVTVAAGRIAWTIVNGPIPDGLLILHTCDNRKCCNPKHLYCGTYTDNNSDRAKRNPHNQGGRPTLV